MSGRFNIALAAVLSACAVSASTPPARLNYQGVLRDATNRPLDGTYDMVFGFYDAPTAGNQILVDQHAVSGANGVAVSNGLFNVALGGGTVSDGSGPGTYASLDQVFRDYGAVYLQIQVGGETLVPRAQVLSSGFSLSTASFGGKPPGQYLDTSSGAQVKNGPLTATSSAPSSVGLTGGGTDSGGVFFNTAASGYAYLGYGDYGISAWGNVSGGFFKDLDSTGYAYVGNGDYGITALGSNAGGYFKDFDGSGSAYLGHGDDGIDASGSLVGGYFHNTVNNDAAYLGSGTAGVEGYGQGGGGFFQDTTTLSYAWSGHGANGVQARGTAIGGSFSVNGHSGQASVADQETGITASGTSAGGHFTDSNDFGEAYVGYIARGIFAQGRDAGGVFVDTDQSGGAYVAYGDRGIWAKGDFAGGTFSDPFNVNYWADVGTPTNKIYGTGAVSFVQNHPYDKGEVIVYAAPEGDEVAVYTRGSARLVDGEAHVALGGTFPLVADPDVGLTAHLTPRGDPVPLSVESLSPTELVVRGPAGSDGAFDYLVFGLRIGFEEMAIVRPKEREAFLPEQAAIQAPYADHPELRTWSALSRFTTMRRSMGISEEPDLTRAHALVMAIDANRPEVVAAAKAAAERERAAPRESAGTSEQGRPAPPPSAKTATTTPVASNASSAAAIATPALPVGTAPVPVAEEVQAGDVLAIDPSGGPALKRAGSASDPGVVGIVGGEPGRTWSATAPIAFAGTVVSAHVDAVYGAILTGDLLVASPTHGYAMRAGATPVQGTVVGKALEPHTSGTGTIRVLVMSR